MISGEKDTKSHAGLFGKAETSDAGLPRILIIGDSISQGYTKGVRKLMRGKAEVYRIPANGQYTSFGLKHIKEWLRDYNWDIIHFNWGIHDLMYIKKSKAVDGDNEKVIRTTPEQYEDNLCRIIKELKRTDAKLIWASTTPLSQGCKIPPGSEVKYNAIAENIMKENNVVINDLHSYAMLRIQKIQLSDGNVHFTEVKKEKRRKRQRFFRPFSTRGPNRYKTYT